MPSQNNTPLQDLIMRTLPVRGDISNVLQPSSPHLPPALLNPAVCHSSPLQYTNQQLFAIRAIVEREKVQESVALGRLRVEKEELSRLESEIIQLERIHDTTESIQSAEAALEDLSFDIRVLSSNVALLCHDPLANGSQPMQQITENVRLLQEMSHAASSLQDKITEFSQQKTAIVAEKLELTETLFSNQQAVVENAERIARIHTTAINEYQAGPLNIVNRIPRGVLAEIFKYAEEYRMEMWSKRESGSKRYILPISQVCWYWQDICAGLGNTFYGRDIGTTPPKSASIMYRTAQLNQHSTLYLEVEGELNHHGTSECRLGQYYDHLQRVSSATLLFRDTLPAQLPLAVDLHLVNKTLSSTTIPSRLLEHTQSLTCNFLPKWEAPSLSIQHLTIDTSEFNPDLPYHLTLIVNAIRLLPNLKSLRILCAHYNDQIFHVAPNAQPHAHVSNIQNLAISTTLAPYIHNIMYQGRIELPKVKRLTYLVRGGSSKALFPKVSHLQIQQALRIWRNDGALRDLFISYQNLTILEVDGGHVVDTIGALRRMETAAGLETIRNLIINNWIGDGMLVYDYLKTRNVNVKRLRKVLFENCPNVEGPMRAAIEEYCEVQWEPSCVEVNGWTA